MSESELINGLYPKPKHPNAPDFVIGKLSINVAQFREWMKGYLAANPGAKWITIDMKESKNGKGYAVIDNWKPTRQGDPTYMPPANEPPPVSAPAQQQDFTDDDIPF